MRRVVVAAARAGGHGRARALAPGRVCSAVSHSRATAVPWDGDARAVGGMCARTAAQWVTHTHTRVRPTPACAELLWRLPSGCAVGRPCARWTACADACRPIHDGGERNAARRRRLAVLSVCQQSTHGRSAQGKRVAAHIPGCTSPRRCCVTITSPRQSVHGAMSISLAGRALWRTSCDSSHA